MDLLHSTQDIKRLNELAAILVRYGFSDLLHRLQINDSLLQLGKLMRIQMPEERLIMSAAARARCALEEMGPTFIKLGQLLATRIDLLPEEWIKEFEKLQDQTPALPYNELKPTLIRALGRSFESEFKHIDPIALGSASMAQVHRATTRSGEEIVLKIQRPHIRRKIESDIRLMYKLANIAQQQSHELRRYHPAELIKEFERSLTRELDFAHEARNSEKIARNLKNFRFLIVPKVYWRWTCEEVNAQAYIEGIPARDTAAIDAAGLDRKVIVRRGAQVIWQMMLIDGFFHADPHPGNFLALPKNRIAMLDFGMVGRLTRARKQQLFSLMHNIVVKNSEEVALTLLHWSGTSTDVLDQLSADIDAFIDNYYGLSLNEIPIPTIVRDLTHILRSYNIQMPSDIAMFSKTCITLEGFGRLLYPDFNLTSEAKPLIEKAIKEKLNPISVAKETYRLLSKRADRMLQSVTAPTQSEQRTQNPPVQIDKRHLDKLTTRVEKSIYRLIQGTLLASLFIGSAVVATIPTGPHLFGLHLFGLLGFMAVAISSAWLLFLMWWTMRSRD